METYHHHPMTMDIAQEELGQALIAIIPPKKNRKCITSISILKFILITIMLTININNGIEKHVICVVYIIMWLLSVGREWKQERG